MRFLRHAFAPLRRAPAAETPLTRLSRVRPDSRAPRPDTLRTAPAHTDPCDSAGTDHPGGPTHQPGVMPGPGYEALRTPFDRTGPPGAGLQRNVTDLDLAANRHRDGYAFAADNGRDTNAVPRAGS